MNNTLKEQEQLIYDDLNSAIAKINAIENSADKAVFLAELWSQAHALAENISRHNNFVSGNVIEEFFKRHNKYNDHIFLRMSGTYTEAYVLGVPVFNVSLKKRHVTFTSMDSIDDGLGHILGGLEKGQKDLQKNLHTLNEILAMSNWDIFVRELKERTFISPSTIKKGLKGIAERKNKEQETLEHNVNKYNLINDHKKDFLNFINAITSYVYKAFEQEGFTCELEDLESTVYLQDAIPLFLLRENNKGSGLSVEKSESYWLCESVPFIEAKIE